MDAFYASVEQRDRPELRGTPVIVAWSPEPRGVVVAASYEARTFGVYSAMPATRAARLCPKATWVTPDFVRYKAVSSQIRTIFERHTRLVEPLSLDEAYLDVTEELTGIPSATETAQIIRREIREETNLTASAGVAPNKFLAKIASDWKKPDGLFVIRPHQVENFLTGLPVAKIPGVGKVTEAALHREGIRTVGELRTWEQSALMKIFGRYGERLWELARGIDESPVIPSRRVKQISSENTFSGNLTLQEVAAYLDKSAGELWESVARKKRVGRTVTVKLRTSDFQTATRRATSSVALTSAEEFAALAQSLLGRFSFPATAMFRLAGIGMSNFLDEHEEDPEEGQEGLFGIGESDENLSSHGR